MADGAIWGWLAGATLAATMLAVVPGWERGTAERAAAIRLDAVPADRGVLVRSDAVPDGGAVDVRAVCVRGGRRPDITWDRLPNDTAEVAVVTELVDGDGTHRVHDVVLRLDPARAGWHAGGPHNGGDASPFVAPCRSGATTMRITVVALRSPLPAGIDGRDDPATVLDALAAHATARRTISAAFPR